MFDVLYVSVSYPIVRILDWDETEKGVVITSAVYSCVIFVDFENICLSNRLR
jgi:hypothetical protein